MTENHLKTAIVFGDGRLPRGRLTKATRERLADLISQLEPEGITHVFLAGGERSHDHRSKKVVSEAFLMRRFLLMHVVDKNAWFRRITLEESMGTMNNVRETMTLLNQKELSRAPIIVIAQRLRLVHLRLAFRALGWCGDEIAYRECPTRWETEKPCVQGLRIVGAVLTPLGGALMTLPSRCRNRLVALAAPPQR